MNTRSRSLAWDATTAIEALAAADTALWIWTPSDDQMRFTGATRALGLGPLAPDCTGAAFCAVAMPQDRTLAQTVEDVRMAAAATLSAGVAATAVLGPKAAAPAGRAFRDALFA